MKFVFNSNSDYCVLVDVNDLDKFVNVALHTSAGEGDESSDKLSDLKTVGSGFGPLIYGLLKDPSYDSFQQGCRAVWDVMKTTPHLPKLLVQNKLMICLCMFVHMH